MEKFLELEEAALKHIKNAEYGITFTYPLVKESKVLISVVNHLFLACTNIAGSLLYYELLYKSISPFPDNFESKFHIMKNALLDKYNLDPDYLKMMRKLREIIIAHNNSPIEFSRAGKYVICNDEYDLKEITLPWLKETHGKTKLFIDEVISITHKRQPNRKKEEVYWGE